MKFEKDHPGRNKCGNLVIYFSIRVWGIAVGLKKVGTGVEDGGGEGCLKWTHFVDCRALGSGVVGMRQVGGRMLRDIRAGMELALGLGLGAGEDGGMGEGVGAGGDGGLGEGLRKVISGIIVRTSFLAAESSSSGIVGRGVEHFLLLGFLAGLSVVEHGGWIAAGGIGSSSGRACSSGVI
jgi:hypothetical protein